MSGNSMTANHVEHEIATFPGSPGGAAGPAIAYSRVGTDRTPSAVPSSSNFPTAHLDSEPGLIAQFYRPFSSSHSANLRGLRAGSSGHLLPPSPPAEKAPQPQLVRQEQT